MQVPEDSLVVAEPVELTRDKRSFKVLQLRCLPGTWRERMGRMKPIPMGQLLAYLNPVLIRPEDRAGRVIDHADLRQYKIPFSEIAE